MDTSGQFATSDRKKHKIYYYLLFRGKRLLIEIE